MVIEKGTKFPYKVRGLKKKLEHSILWIWERTFLCDQILVSQVAIQKETTSCTAYDNQESVFSGIYEGERADIKNNFKIGEVGLRLENKKAKQGYKLKVIEQSLVNWPKFRNFSFTLSGICEIGVETWEHLKLIYCSSKLKWF